MSKGQRGNKEAKKPKKARSVATPPVPAGTLQPLPGTAADVKHKK
jgi:hypothetical protein